jgi:hypothetical protein
MLWHPARATITWIALNAAQIVKTEPMITPAVWGTKKLLKTDTSATAAREVKIRYLLEVDQWNDVNRLTMTSVTMAATM